MYMYKEWCTFSPVNVSSRTEFVQKDYDLEGNSYRSTLRVFLPLRYIFLFDLVKSVIPLIQAEEEGQKIVRYLSPFFAVARKISIASPHRFES